MPNDEQNDIVARAEAERARIADAKTADIRAEMDELRKGLALVAQELGKMHQAAASNPPANTGLDGLKSILSAMKELRSYDNEVIKTHEATRDAARKDMAELASLSDMADIEGDAPENKIFMEFLKNLITPRNPPSQATPGPSMQQKISSPSVVPGSILTPQKTEVINTDADKIDIKELVAHLPATAKADIKDGKKGIADIKAAAELYGLDLTENQVQEIIDEVKR